MDEVVVDIRGLSCRYGTKSLITKITGYRTTEIGILDIFSRETGDTFFSQNDEVAGKGTVFRNTVLEINGFKMYQL